MFATGKKIINSEKNERKKTGGYFAAVYKNIFSTWLLAKSQLLKKKYIMITEQTSYMSIK